MKKTLIELLKEVLDYRQGNTISHSLSDFLMIGLLSESCNGDTFADMALFGETHEAILRNFWDCQMEYRLMTRLKMCLQS